MSVMFHLSPSLRPPLKRGFLVCTPTALLLLHTVHASSGTRESLAVTTMSDFSTRLVSVDSDAVQLQGSSHDGNVNNPRANVRSRQARFGDWGRGGGSG